MQRPLVIFLAISGIYSQGHAAKTFDNPPSGPPQINLHFLKPEVFQLKNMNLEGLRVFNLATGGRIRSATLIDLIGAASSISIENNNVDVAAIGPGQEERQLALIPTATNTSRLINRAILF